MKHLPPAILLALFLCTSAALRAADAKAEPAPAVTKTSVAGHYVGEWKGTGDARGELRIQLKQDGATWAAEAKFTFESADVATKMKTVEVDGVKVMLVFDWEIQGTPGQSTISGELKEDSLQGTFETKSPEGPSKGTWKVTRK